MEDEDVIVVTGKRITDTLPNTIFARPWMVTDFGIFQTTPAGSGGASAPVSQVATAEKNDYKIPATDKMPQFELKGLTKEQYEDFMQAYDNVANDPELAAQMQTLATNGVKLSVGVQETLPPGAHDDSRATIEFYAVASDLEGNNEYVMPTTNVVIVVKASAIRDDLTWEDTFQGIIAHELTHLKRDADGKYLEDHVGDGYTGTTTYDKDDETYDNLYGDDSLANYSDSWDVVKSVDEFGFAVFTGTSGNNTINMIGSGAFAAYTGGGNDLVVGDNDQTVIYADGPGKKAIVDTGGVDTLVMGTISTASKIVLTYVGSDLYITSSDSTHAPIDDPDAVVVVGQVSASMQNAIESVSAADFTGFDIYNWVGTAAPASASDTALDGLGSFDESVAVQADFNGDGSLMMYGNAHYKQLAYAAEDGLWLV